MQRGKTSGFTGLFLEQLDVLIFLNAGGGKSG